MLLTLRRGFQHTTDENSPLYGLFRKTDCLTVLVDKLKITSDWLDSDKSDPVWKYQTTILLNGSGLREHEVDYKVAMLRLKYKCPELFNF